MGHKLNPGHGGVAWAVAGAAFAALFLLRLPFPPVVAAAALVGALLPGRFAPPSHGRAQDGPPGPPKERRLSEGDVAAAAEAAGLRLRGQRELNDHLLLFHLAAT